MATLLLHRAATPLLRLDLHHHRRRQRVAVGLLTVTPNCRNFSTESELTRPNPNPNPNPNEGLSSSSNKSNSNSSSSSRSARDPPKYPKWDDPDYEEWKVKEAEILADVQPVLFLTKDILHSDRYMDGEQLTLEDEKIIVEKLLAHHPHSEDKIGCGLDSIMVDRHPQFRHSRCLFVVRTDGGWIDFSYQKCLRSYVQSKYPAYAARFIREHFKRSS